MTSPSSLTRISGIASGMDTESLVKKLMDAERVRYNKMKQDQQTLQWKSDSYRQWNTDLFSFRSKDLFNMKLLKTYNAFTTSLSATASSDSNAVTASANADAIEGTHKVFVKQLAEAATFKTNINIDPAKELGDASIVTAQKLNLDDTLTIKTTDASGTTTLTGSIAVKKTDKISDVINALNSAKDADGKSLGLQATYDTNLQQLIIKTKATGAKTSIEITAANNGNSNIFGALGINGNADGVTGQAIMADKTGFSGNIDVTSVTNGFKITGADALLNFDGTGGSGGTNVTSSSNTVNVLGVNYTLKSKTSGDISITTTRDVEGAVKNIKDFITKYNEMVDKIYKATTEPVYKDYKPLTDDQRTSLSEKQIEQWETKAKSGLLKRDDILTGLYNKIRNDISSVVNNGSQYNTLSSIGIKSNDYSDHGKLTVDEEKLRAALVADPEGVKNLFSQSSTPTLTNTGAVTYGGAAYSLTLDYEDTAGKSHSSTISIPVNSTKDDIIVAFKSTGLTASIDTNNKLVLSASNSMMSFSLKETTSGDLAKLGFSGTTVSSTTTNRGIANRLYDDFYDAFQNTVKKAGTKGSQQDDESIVGKMLGDLSKRMSTENDRLTRVENSYYQKFTAMETAMSKYNSQASWMAQQFGGGK